MALKGKITEFLMRMEREGSIVPSTDGKETGVPDRCLQF